MDLEETLAHQDGVISRAQVLACAFGRSGGGRCRNACQSRRTTPSRLLAALELLSRLPRRALLFEVIADAATGAYSALRAGWRQGLAPCRLAVIVGRVLRSRGWTGELKPCGPDCLAVIGDAAA